MNKSLPSFKDIVDMVDSPAITNESIEKLKELVSFDSLLGNENEAQVYIHEVYNSLGLKVDRFQVKLEDIEKLKGYSPVDWKYDGKENVVGVFEPKNNLSETKGRSLILNGHIDVVPTGRETLWTQHPFSPYVKDNKLYGRGSGDMKAGIIACVMALRVLKELGVEPASKVILQSVVEEECTGNGTLACLARGYRADAALIPEPFPFIVTAEVGLMWSRVTVRGRPAHVLEMGTGVNAIDGAMHIVSALRQLEAKWNTVTHPAFEKFSKHPLNFNLGQITGGEWTSSVPCECTFELRVGFYPGEDLADIRKQLSDCIEKAANEKQIGFDISWNGFQAEGCVMDRESDFIKTLGSVYSKCLNKEPKYDPILCGTDCRFFQCYYDIPTTCLGPESNAIHGIDEYVCLESYKEIIKVYACFIAEWCGLQHIII